MNQEEYVTPKKATEILGCVTRTLRNMEKQGRIQSIRTDSNHRRYNIKEYLARTNTVSKIPPTRIKVCYCRVSSRGQKADLERQVAYMERKFPSHQIIKDIGSGLNFKREGIKTLLELSYSGTLEEVVVAYKDRLCRFGFELFEQIFKRESNAKIVVLNNVSYSPEEEFSKDILQILTVFSARIHGLKKYKVNIEKDKDLPEPHPKKNA